jgi:hypothetical protein
MTKENVQRHFAKRINKLVDDLIDQHRDTA